MDCEMPIINGYDSSKKIREIDPFEVFIIGISGHEGDAHQRKCRISGMNSTFMKPVDVKKLEQILKEALE